MTVSIELSVDRSLLLNMLSDGMDYACRGFWAQIEEYKWQWWYAGASDSVDNDKISPDLTDDTVLCRIRDDEDGMAEEEDRPFVDITIAKLEKAFGWVLQHYPHLLAPFETNSSGTIIDVDYDAIGADALIQRIVLGEITYG